MGKLVTDEGGQLWLEVVSPEGKPLMTTCDFLSGASQYRSLKTGGRGQIFAKALGVKKGYKTVVDATAGFGADALAMAYLGFKVIGVEQNHLIYELLKDAKSRFDNNVDEAQKPSGSLRFVHKEAANYLKDSVLKGYRPDVVYLDPMYSEQSRKAKPNKQMQALHCLLKEEPLAQKNLMKAALQVAGHRVVVKRSPKAPSLFFKSDFCYSGKAVRYDIYENLRQNNGELRFFSEEDRLK